VLSICYRNAVFFARELALEIACGFTGLTFQFARKFDLYAHDGGENASQHSKDDYMYRRRGHIRCSGGGGYGQQRERQHKQRYKGHRRRRCKIENRGMMSMPTVEILSGPVLMRQKLSGRLLVGACPWRACPKGAGTWGACRLMRSAACIFCTASKSAIRRRAPGLPCPKPVRLASA